MDFARREVRHSLALDYCPGRLQTPVDRPGVQYKSVRATDPTSYAQVHEFVITGSSDVHGM